MTEEPRTENQPGGFCWRGREIRRAAVIGSGQIGPDIALHLVKALSPRGVDTVVLDISEAALESGRGKMFGKIAKGVRSGAFREAQAARMQSSVRFTSDYGSLAGVDLVIEAASEDLAIKRRIFRSVEDLAGPEAVLLSNSSHLEPSRIFRDLSEPARAAVAHYFFPAERNPVVEIVAAEPARELVPWLLGFYEEIGKVPVAVESRFGHALNPIFEGMFLAAALAVEEGLGTSKEVDDVARRALRLGIGPFTAMNLTGGNPITYEGFSEMRERLHPWFRVPRLLEEAVAEEGPTGRVWDVPARGEDVAVPDDRRRRIEERITAAYLGLAAWTAAEGAISVPDLDMSCHLALAVVRPFGLMRKLGAARVSDLLASYREREPDFFDPAGFADHLENWTSRPVARIGRSDVAAGAGTVAVLTIRRPEVLGALDEELFAELEAHLDTIATDDAALGVVITGFGVKAFVSGADIRTLAGIRSSEDGERLSRGSHRVFNRIAGFAKPVVCALNGMAVGGGNELAMACHARIAREGLKVLARQPEPNIGIIPGAGGTQRLPRLIGVEAAWEILRTGRPVSGKEALEFGLVSELVLGERLRDRAVQVAAEAASDRSRLPDMPAGPISVPDELPEVDIGHLSRPVDALIQRAVREGAATDLASGLEHEIRLFGEGCGLEDMRIGVRNFIENGPRTKAAFVHR